MKKIGLIVSQYDSGQWIEQRLTNIRESSIIDDIEIICVNADSPDERDDEIPKKMVVKYIKCPARIGIYEAWNMGIKELNVEYVANANTDDLVSPTCYEEQANVLASKARLPSARRRKKRPYRQR